MAIYRELPNGPPGPYLTFQNVRIFRIGDSERAHYGRKWAKLPDYYLIKISGKKMRYLTIANFI